jgi:hypothetical protein
VEAAFLNAVASKGVDELGVTRQGESKSSKDELTKAMYGNLDDPLQ